MEDYNNKKDFSDSGVVFDDEWKSSLSYSDDNTPNIVRWVIKYSSGLIKNEKQATYVIYGFVVLIIIISLFLVLGGNNPQNNIEIRPAL